MGRKSAYDLALEAFEQSADALGLSADLRTAMRAPDEVREIRVPVRMNGGETRSCAAFEVRHNGWRGPVQGGVLYRPDVTMDGVKALAMRMTWKWALLGIPLGGGACGVAVDAQGVASAELPHPLCHEVPLTGEATGRGVFHAVAAACEHLRIPLRNARVAVEGFGAAGSAAAALLAAAGATIVGAGDSRGAIYAERGLDVQKLIRHKSRSGSVVGFPGSEPITECELLAAECHVLVAAALGNSIHCQNASAIQARIVAEAAHTPLTSGADRILEAKDIFLIPDLLCNACGPAVFHFASRQNEAGVERELESTMRRCFQEILAASVEHRVNMRKAAHLLAIGRVAAARTTAARHA